MNKIEIKISHPPEWPTKTIYEACQIVSRGTAPVYVENSTVLAIGQRCVREFGLQPEEARFHDQRSMTRVLKACKGDVLLNSTGTGTIGRSCIFNADGTYIIDGHVTVLRSDTDQLDGRWLNALLQSPQGQLHLETQCYSGSTNQVELSRKRLSATSIPLPSLPEQRRIAEILDTIDEAIQKTEALISKLKAMKQGLLHDLLTRGLDKNGKLRDPKAHPEQFKDSSLGRIPRRWDVRPLGVTATLQRGFDLPIQDRRPGDVPVFGSNGIDGRHNEGRVVGPGVITGRSGSIGFVYYTDTYFWPLNTTLYVKDFHGNRPKFIRFLLESVRLDRFVAATGVPSLNRNFVHPIEVTVPEPAEQDRIVDVVEAHDARIRTEEQYRDKLKLQKKGLMHDLLTGKVRIKV